MNAITYKNWTWALGISAIVLVILYFVTNVFSIIINLFTFSLVGLIWGIVKKDRYVWIPALVFMVLTILGGSCFFYPIVYVEYVSRIIM